MVEAIRVAMSALCLFFGLLVFFILVNEAVKEAERAFRSGNVDNKHLLYAAVLGFFSWLDLYVLYSCVRAMNVL